MSTTSTIRPAEPGDGPSAPDRLVRKPATGMGLRVLAAQAAQQFPEVDLFLKSIQNSARGITR